MTQGEESERPWGSLVTLAIACAKALWQKGLTFAFHAAKAEAAYVEPGQHGSSS